MSANKIAETSTSTGTGDFALAGAWNIADSFNTGNLSFNSYYGLNHVFPYMIQDKLGNWESGEGHLSSSTNLVRLSVFNNSLGTTDKVNFPAGDKLVCVPTDARAFGSRMLNKVNYSLTGPSAGVRNATALAVNTLYVMPTLISAPCKLTQVAYTVTSPAAAGKTMRVGIYNLTKQSDTGNSYDSVFPLLIDLGTVDVASSGAKFINVDLKLGQGVYGFAVISDGTPSLMASGTNLLDLGMSPNTYQNQPVSFWNVSSAPAFTALPVTTPNAMSAIMNAPAPQAMIKGGIQ